MLRILIFQLFKFKLLSVIASLLLIFIPGDSISQDLHELRESLPTESLLSGINFEFDSSNIDDFPVLYSIPDESVVTDYISIHFKDFRYNPDSAWEISILDSNSRQLKQVITNTNIPVTADGYIEEFWSDRIQANKLLLEINAIDGTEDLHFRIDYYAYQVKDLTPKSIRDDNDPTLVNMYHLRTNDLYYYSSQAVARLNISSIQSKRIYTCTGFLISDNYLMTNAHCVPEGLLEGQSCNSKIEFYFEDVRLIDKQVGLGLNTIKKYDCKKLIQNNCLLDYAVFELDGNPGKWWNKIDKWSSLNPIDLDITTDDDVKSALKKSEKYYIVQYPTPHLSKQIVHRNCLITQSPISVTSCGKINSDSSEVDLKHICDTGFGSSGSPIINSAGKLVGLHHKSFVPGTIIENRFSYGVIISKIYEQLPDYIKSHISLEK